MKKNRWIQGTGWLLLCVLCLGFPSRALGQDVILKAGEEKVEVSMGGSAEEAVSMRLSLEVELTEGDAEVSFEFAPEIQSSIKQYRYEKETGTLNLYVSGDQRQRIFQEEEFCLGSVVLDPGTGGSASATVSVKEDSLVIVNDAYDRRREEIHASPAQKISVGIQDTGPDDGTEKEPDDGSEKEPDTGTGDRPDDGSGEDPQPGPGSSGKDDRTDHSSGSSKNPGGSAGEASGESGQVKPSLESARQGRRDVGIRAGSLQTAEPEEALDTDAEPQEEARPEEETAAEEETGEMTAPEELPSAEPESEPDVLLFSGVAAGAAAAGIVILLMILEYRKLQKKRKK